MEKVVDPEDGVAPTAAQVPGYLVAGKTGTAQRVARRLRLLRRHHHRLLRRLRAGRRPPLHGLRRGPRTQGRRRRRHDRRVRRSPGSWATPWAATASRRPTASRRACPSSGDSIPSAGASTPRRRRARSSPSSTRCADLADWLGGQTDVGRARRPRRRRHRHLAEHRSASAPATCTPPSRARAPTVPTSPTQALAAGAVAVLTDAAGLDRLPPGHARPRRDRAAPRARARSPRGSTATPPPDLRVIGVTGTQGKTTTTRVLEQGLTEAGVTCRRRRHRRHPHRRRRREDPAHHARGAGPARPLRGHARARRRHLRDGGLQPRARARPGRRGRLRRRDLPQPRARPPRLPRRRRRLLRRQGRSLHPGAGPASG